MGTFAFKLPDIGEGVVEGEVVEWMVAVGDTVKEDDPILSVMTDKATVEIPAPCDGTVTKIIGEAGDILPVGVVCIEFEVDGDGNAAASEPAPAAEEEKAEPKSEPEPTPEPTPEQSPNPHLLQNRLQLQDQRSNVLLEQSLWPVQQFVNEPVLLELICIMLLALGLQDASVMRTLMFI